MILSEDSPLPGAALPLEPFKAHLRLGTGFGTADLQDEVLEGFLRAALAAVEARTGKALISRDFTWSIAQWRDSSAQVLPLAPVEAVTAVVRIDAAGAEEVLDPGRYWLEQDAHHPRLHARGAALPQAVAGGGLRVAMRAGLATGWGGLPADLAQAVLLLAAHYYEYRAETALSRGCMPFGVTSLIERYRPLRVALGVVK